MFLLLMKCPQFLCQKPGLRRDAHVPAAFGNTCSAWRGFELPSVHLRESLFASGRPFSPRFSGPQIVRSAKIHGESSAFEQGPVVLLFLEPNSKVPF